MLKYMKKGETPETMIRGANIIRAAGIRISTGFIIGLPGETDETVQETIALAKQIQPFRIQFSRWTPLAGSELVENPEHFNINPLSAPALETYLLSAVGPISSIIPDGGVVSGAGGFHGAQFRLKMMDASIRSNDQGSPNTSTQKQEQEKKIEDQVDRWIRECYAACGAKRTGEVDWGLPSI